jgi:hypothetical protein
LFFTYSLMREYHFSEWNLYSFVLDHSLYKSVIAKQEAIDDSEDMSPGINVCTLSLFCFILWCLYSFAAHMVSANYLLNAIYLFIYYLFVYLLFMKDVFLLHYVWVKILLHYVWVKIWNIIDLSTEIHIFTWSCSWYFTVLKYRLNPPKPFKNTLPTNPVYIFINL